MIGSGPVSTKSLKSSSEQEKAEIGIEASVLTNVKVQGTAAFEEGMSIRLQIEGSPEPILFKPKPETIFGRRDPATGAMPDIDLTPFAGYRMGVSRRHAAIRFGDEQTLDLWDLGSSNGTFLNGQRLSAHRPYRIHDGDEIRLGQMALHIFFEASEKSTQARPETPKPAQAEQVPSVPIITVPEHPAPTEPINFEDLPKLQPETKPEISSSEQPAKPEEKKEEPEKPAEPPPAPPKDQTI